MSAEQQQKVFLPFPKSFAVWSLLVLLNLQAAGQDADSSRTLVSTVTGDARNFLRATGFVFSGPARWDAGDWTLMGGVTAGAAGAALLDDEMLGLMNRHRGTAANGVSRAAERYGVAGYAFALGGGTYLAGLLLDDQWLRETAFLTVTAVVLSGAVSSVTKAVVGRARPHTGFGNHRFRVFTPLDDDFHAFPSGHTVVAFSVSTVLARRIDNPWVTAGLYALAASTGLSRMYTRNHWFSDVVFGAATATAVSASLVSWYEQDPGSDNSSGLRILPSGNGVIVVWVF